MRALPLSYSKLPGIEPGSRILCGAAGDEPDGFFPRPSDESIKTLSVSPAIFFSFAPF